jgi:putative ATP-dependent endonuclease of the OLD family
VKIVRLRIKNFRCIKTAEIFPGIHNVLVGPNNTGKTVVLEAMNLLLNPETSARWAVIDENDFFRRQYLSSTSEQQSASGDSIASSTATVIFEPPNIRIEAVLSDLKSEDEDVFADYLVPWKIDSQAIVEDTAEGVDPFEAASAAIRVVFEGRYDAEEDDFSCRTFFLTSAGLNPDECHDVGKRHKRQIGFSFIGIFVDRLDRSPQSLTRCLGDS